MRLAGFMPDISTWTKLAAMQADELLTYEELGELLRLKKTAMAAAKRRGELPPVTIDPVFAERSAKAVAARRAKARPPQTGRRRGRPTKAEEIRRRR